jgi:exopolysaccharide biosynthesis polyprenyl glycosylphosphotransferase
VAFFNQELFSTFLCLERKRCERSGDPFGLALLEVALLADSTPLCSTLCSQLRETDITGWYREPSTVGIIFTTLNGAPIPQIRTRLLSKIDDILRLLIPRDAWKVPVALHIFPEDVSQKLYPDRFSSRHKSSFHVMKRVIDIGGSLGAIILLSPVFLSIAALIKLTSPGPVFFRQKRLGLLGKEFEFLKFRSMYTDNDPAIHKEYVTKLIQNQQEGTSVFKIRNDPRVTPLGRFLRKSSLDELPQFINVLKGEMSLVGPRPPIPYEMEKYQYWHRRRVLEAKPGITGLWQVHGRSRTTFDEMVRLDIRYITEQSPWLDIKIVLLTPFAVLSAAGAY